MEETAATRLKLFIDTNGMSSTQFADLCGIPRPSLSQILSGRNKKFSDVLVGQIHRAFPDLSVLWLLFGEGPVRVSASPNACRMDGGASHEGSSGSATDSGHLSSTEGGIAGEGCFDRDGCDAGGAVGGISESQNPETRGIGGAASGNSILSGFKNANNGANIRENQVFESDLKIMDLRRQIEQMRQNPRKVVQITIYYDDSTFETFTPKG